MHTGDISIEELIAAAVEARCFVFDLETTGLDPLQDRIEGIAFFVPATATRKPTRAWYPFVDGTFIVTDDEGNISNLRPAMNQAQVIEALRPLFSLPDIVAIAHNAKFDTAFLYFASGTETPLEVSNRLADSMVADYISDERRYAYGLKLRVKQLFGVEMTTYNEAVRGQSMLNFMQQKPLGSYAMDDCQWTYELFASAIKSIRSQSKPRRSTSTTPTEMEVGRPLGDLEAIYWGIEMKLTRVIMEMETTGVLIDWQHLVDVEERLVKRRIELAERIEDFLGWPCNPKSQQQVVDALFSPPPNGIGLPRVGIPVGVDGLPSTGDKVIKHFKRFHPLVQDILELRSIDTLLTGFVRKIRVLAQQSFDGRIRTKFSQTGTVIGRLSSSDPFNGQNMPRDKDLVRKSFCAALPIDPDPELVLLGGDYGQVELRVASHLAKEDNMREVYRMGDNCRAENGGPCERFRFYECKDCNNCSVPITAGDRLCCAKCFGEKIEHQKRCRHVDLHQRTAEDANVKRNPLAKCLDGSTMVLTPDGPRAIDALIDKDQEPGVHHPATGISLDDASGGWVVAESSIVRHERPTKIIVTKRAVVIATDDHRLQVYGDGLGDLKIGTPGYVHEPGMSLVAASKLEPGMKLPPADFGHHRPADFHAGKTPTSVRINPFTGEVGSGPTVLSLDEDWAYFAGMFIGDGCASSGHQFVITHGDKDEYAPWRDVVMDSCRRIGLPASLAGDKRSTRLGSRVVYDILSRLGLAATRRSSEKHGKTLRVPDWVIKGGPKIVWAFMAGLWDTDGSFSPTNGVGRLVSKSPELVGQVAFLLRWLGVSISVSLAWNEGYQRHYYTVNVLANGFKEFARYCPLRAADKIERLNARVANIKCPRIAGDDEIIAVLDGGNRTVYDFHVKSESHLYMQQGLRAHNNLNFGLLYRMAAPKFCVYADLFDADGRPMVTFAQTVIERWFAAYPAISVFHKLHEEQLPYNNFIAKTITGRFRRLDREYQRNPYRATTQSIQFVVSGSSQDLIKIAMTRIYARRNKMIANSIGAVRRAWEKCRLLLQVHDELLMQAHKDVAQEFADIFRTEMVNADGGLLSVPLECKVKIGRTWDDVH
jgi:DNA polymerase I-like protein with 3'-5' exonuclease and polymerase domains